MAWGGFYAAFARQATKSAAPRAAAWNSAVHGRSVRVEYRMARDDDEADEVLTSIEGGDGEGAVVSGEPGEPPVVARLIVEIRSDGSRTIARGALEDLSNGEQVAIEAHGRSPMSLALGLAKSIMRVRGGLARSATRALLSRTKNKS